MGIENGNRSWPADLAPGIGEFSVRESVIFDRAVEDGGSDLGE